MLKDVTHVKALEGHKLLLTFEDGITGTVDVKEITAFRGVFAPLENPAEFSKVSVNGEIGVVCWPTGADLDSDVLYATITNQPIRLSNVTQERQPRV